THRRRCGNETTESALGLSQNRAASHSGFRSENRQRCGSPYPERALPARIQQWPCLAHFSRPQQRQLVELHLFRCESATLRTPWVLVVMDQFTRRIIGFGILCSANIPSALFVLAHGQRDRTQQSPWYGWRTLRCAEANFWR